MSLSSVQQYETMYVLKSGASDSDSATLFQKLENVIQKFDGKIHIKEDWGLRDLAYSIKNEKSGRYHVFVYSGKSGVVEEIERHFKIIDKVIRYLTVSVPHDYDFAKIKKQIHATEEDVRKAREQRKKPQ